MLSKLCFHNVPCRKRRRHLPADIEPKSPEQICIHGSFQANECFSSPRFYSAKGLALQSGPIPSVLPPTNCQVSQTVFTGCLPERIASNDVSAFWTQHSPKSFRKLNQLGCPGYERTRCPDNRVPGRFSDSSPKLSAPARARSVTTEPSSKSRMAGKCQEIHSDSSKIPCLSRHSVESLDKQKIPTKRKNNRHYQKSSDHVRQQDNLLEDFAKPYRCSKLRKFCHTHRQIAFSSSTKITQFHSKHAQQGVILPTDRSSKRIEMVANKLPPIIINSPSSPHSLPNNGRFRFSLGCTAGRLSNNRDVDRSGEILALQCERDACYPQSPRDSRKSSEPILDLSAVRQSDRSSLFTEGRRDKVSTANESNDQDLSSAKASSNKSNGSAHTRHIQWSCRSFVPSSSHTGMASFASGHGSYFPEIRDSNIRSLCIKSCTCGSQLCVIRPQRSASSLSRRLLSPVELPPCMGFSTILPNSEGAVTSQPSEGHFPITSTQMESSVLAERPKVASTSSAIYHSQSQAEPDRRSHGSTTPQGSRYDNGSMEVWGWSRSLTDWNNSQLNLLHNSWRQSTRRTYKIAWTRWLSWAKKYGIDPLHPTGSIIARFLADLFLIEKLSYNTILLHKSVVCTLCNTEDAGILSSHVLIKHILKSIAISKPISKKPPIWDVDTLASHLSTNTPDENSMFATSRHTATLLLLSSGRRVHDLTLLSVDSDHLTLHDNSLTLWPVFGSKTDCANYRQSGWKLYANPDNKNLDPVFWIQRTVQLLEERRRKAKSTSLFITIRGEPKEASRTVIAGWIKTLLTEAGISSSPGSLRSAVASKNWSENFPLDEILAKGNWRSSNTFARFYRREVMQAPGSSNMTRLFNPVD